MTELKNPTPLIVFERTTIFVAEGQFWLGNNLAESAIPMTDELFDECLYMLWMYIKTNGDREQAVEQVKEDHGVSDG